MEADLQRIKIPKIPKWSILGIKIMVASLAVGETALTELEWGYYVDIPIIKYIFAIFQKINGWGMEAVFFMAGTGILFYLLREHPLQKNRWLQGLSWFFAICMVFGKSYYDLGNWNYVFHGRLQFGLACFVALGYYWLFKHTVILLKVAADKWILYQKEHPKCIERWLFEKHPFAGPLLCIAVCSIPVMIIFFPGTLQWDAHEQIWTYMGLFQPWTAKHPVAVTWLLGQCLKVSRSLFGSDNMALFFYAGPQFVMQWLVFAYGMYVLDKLKTPTAIRWAALLYFSLFPAWQIWGFTVVKDSYYYIFLLLLILLIVHILAEKRIHWWQWVLLALSSIMIANTRNNGIYVLVLFSAAFLLMYWKYWKVCFVLLLCSFLSLSLVKNLYTIPKGIAEGPKREMLSVPLQQTARYVKEHYDDITDDEMAVLSQVFQVDVAQLAELYNPELSDPVKAQFIDFPTGEELKQYFQVWFAQLTRHPDTYIQAFLNHVYGYFYPDREDFWEGIGNYYIGNAQHWQDGYLDIRFGMEYRELRDLYEQTARYLKRIPMIGMLYSCGFQNFVLLGCAIYLLSHKRYRELVVLVPCLLTVLICLVSPVDAFVRYMLPIMAALPVNIAWCHYANVTEEH